MPENRKKTVSTLSQNYIYTSQSKAVHKENSYTVT